MKFTAYFVSMRQRPDRAAICDQWVAKVISKPERKIVQPDGRLRLWACIPEMDNRYLRVILLPDGETVHNAFFDRNYKP